MTCCTEAKCWCQKGSLGHLQPFQTKKYLKWTEFGNKDVLFSYPFNPLRLLGPVRLHWSFTVSFSFRFLGSDAMLGTTFKKTMSEKYCMLHSNYYRMSTATSLTANLHGEMFILYEWSLYRWLQIVNKLLFSLNLCTCSMEGYWSLVSVGKSAAFRDHSHFSF